MIRVMLPSHLRVLASIPGEVSLDVAEPITQRTILDALEQKHPPLAGALRDHATKKRRPLVRFFACKEDISHDPPDDVLPEAIRNGQEPFIIIGAIAGG